MSDATAWGSQRVAKPRRDLLVNGAIGSLKNNVVFGVAALKLSLYPLRQIVA